MRFIYTMQYFLDIHNMHLLAVALLAHPSGEQRFMLLDRMVMRWESDRKNKAALQGNGLPQ